MAVCVSPFFPTLDSYVLTHCVEISLFFLPSPGMALTTSLPFWFCGKHIRLSSVVFFCCCVCASWFILIYLGFCFYRFFFLFSLFSSDTYKCGYSHTEQMKNDHTQTYEQLLREYWTRREAIRREEGRLQELQRVILHVHNVLWK
uniref:Uncharacterized protein n=1 Tax=Trypanosoma congolense (strain IL3000) TaxID=1068625 RepID=G0UMJ7_TRYCI|nr:hypothetical protein, unlikely [Trypanosoma congolense IL3000]